jgi:soluble lytic murein transglycosylase-like protein
MALNFGQLVSGAGVVANRQRQAEDAMLQQRQTLMQVQEANRLMEIRSRMGEGAVDAANVAMPEFVQSPGTVIGNPNAPAPAPAAPAPAAPAANAAPAAAPTRPVAQPSNRPPAAPAVAQLPAAAPRTPDQLVNVPTDQLTAAEFQSLPPQAKQQRIQDLNAARTVGGVAKAPVFAAGYLASGPYDIAAGSYNLAARGVNWLGEKANVTGIGRSLGLIDQNVTRQDLLPLVGDGSVTPMANQALRGMSSSTQQVTQPVTEAQLLERLKTSEATRTKAAQQKFEADIKAAPQTFQKLEEKYKLPAGLLNAVMMAESRGIPNQTSPAGAQGYFQFMPDTATQYKVKVNDLNSEADGAARLLRDLLKSSNGDLQTALAAYNWGIGNVQRQGMDKMPAETRNYIPKVLSFMNGGKQAPAAAPATQTVPQAVATGTATDVATAASNAVPVQPSKDGTMYGPAQLDASARNPQIQQILTTRAALQKQVALFNQYGMGDKAWEAVSKIQALDLGLYKNQADIGVYEGATTGNFSRAMSVLSTFTGSPHQVMQRPDGKFDLYVNGKVAKAALEGSQVEQLVRTQVDSEYRKQLANLQVERGTEEFKSNLRIREETNKAVSNQTLQTAREVQLEIIKGNIKLAEKKLELSGFKAASTNSGDGKVVYSNGLGDVFVIDTQNKTTTINGATVDLGVNAQRVSGVDRSIWSAVNAPQQQGR